MRKWNSRLYFRLCCHLLYHGYQFCFFFFRYQAMKYIMFLEWLIVHILLVLQIRVDQSFKQKINLYFLSGLFTLTTKSCWLWCCGKVHWLMYPGLCHEQNKGDYCHTEDTSLQNTEECPFVMAINWMKSLLKFIKDNFNKNPTRD